MSKEKESNFVHVFSLTMSIGVTVALLSKSLHIAWFKYPELTYRQIMLNNLDNYNYYVLGYIIFIALSKICYYYYLRDKS